MGQHGTPDWWGQGRKPTTYALNDMAELAVRLGSVVNYDRTGEVLWLAGFANGGQPLGYSNLGDPGSVSLSALYPHTGSSCLLITTAPTSGSGVQVFKYLRYPSGVGIGLEVTFAGDDTASYIEFEIVLYDGNYYRINRLRYSQADSSWDLLYGLTDYERLAVQQIGVYQAQVYNTIKLVVDTVLHTYQQVQVNDVRYSTITTTPYSTASTSQRLMIVSIRVYTGSDAATSLRIDNLIVTQNEPV